MKKLSVLFVALLFAGGFAFAQSVEKNKAALQAIYTAINANDWATIDRLVAVNLVDHNIPPGMPNGLEGMKGFVKIFKTAFPDGKIEMIDVVGEGDYVAGYSEFSGTHKAEFMGIPATNKSVRYRSVDWVKFDASGKAIEHGAVDDNMTMMAQLGLAPAAQAFPDIPLSLPAEAAKGASTPEQNKEVARQFFEAFSRRDVEKDMTMLSPKFELRWNTDSKIYGPGTYKMLGETYLKAFSDIKWTPVLQIAEGDKVVSFTTFEGTQTGPLMTIPASNKKISGVKGATIDRFSNGKIIGRTQVTDDMNMLMQLGVIPANK